MQKMLQRGFTLIELLVVIAIIGILAAVVLTSLSGAQESAQDRSVQQTLGSAASAAQIYYNQSGFSYEDMCLSSADPSDVHDLLVSLGNNFATLTFTAATPATPMSDAVPAAGVIHCSSTATEFAVAATLSNGNAWCVDASGSGREVAVADFADIAGGTCDD